MTFESHHVFLVIFSISISGATNGKSDIIVCVYVLQVKVPHLQTRCWHSATSFTLTSGLTEVVLFGGCTERPKDAKTDADFPRIADTTVLQFGESTSCTN